MVLIGTSLSTGLCSKLAMQAKEIVEINPNPVIEVGRVYQFTQTAEALKDIVEGLK